MHSVSGSVQGAGFLSLLPVTPLSCPSPHLRPRSPALCSTACCFLRSLTSTLLPLTLICKLSPSCSHFFCKRIPLLLKENTASPTAPSPASSSLLPAQPNYSRVFKFVSTPSLLSHFTFSSIALVWLSGSSQLPEGHQRLGATLDPAPPLMPHHRSSGFNLLDGS